MPIFKKDDEVIDLTDLQRRGILKKQDFSSPPELPNSPTPSLPPQPEPEITPNPLSFFDDIIKANTPNSTGTNSSSLTSSPPLQVFQNSDFKVKLEDLEYKLERL